MVQLSDDLVTALAEEAARRGLSRSALIRQVLQDYLDAEVAGSIGRRIADGYRRIPPLVPDGWGDLGLAAEVATGDLLARLDAEEEAGGHRPW